MSCISYTSHCLMEMYPVLHKFPFSVFDGDVSFLHQLHFSVFDVDVPCPT